MGETAAASRRPEKRVQAAAASSLGCGGEAGSRVPTVSTPYLPYPDFFPLFLIRKRWDTAGYVYPGVSARVPVSPRTRTAIRQFLPYPCFVADLRFFKLKNTVTELIQKLYIYFDNHTLTMPNSLYNEMIARGKLLGSKG